MILRLLQILLFIPCGIIDGITVIFIGIPLWIFCGIKITETKDSLLGWLMELTNKN